MQKRAFLIHGWGGSPNEGWRPWLKDELEKRGFEVFAPSMPDTDSPKLTAWLDKLKETVGVSDNQCFFVGHSLGCITILRYLEKLAQEQKIGGAVLVAGFTDKGLTLGEDENINDIGTFFEVGVDFEKIKKRRNKFIAIHSDNDPYVPLRFGDILKEKLGAELIVKHDMSHFSGDDNINELPCVLEAVLKISGHVPDM